MENTFIGADAKTYVLSPLTLGDTKRFVKWAKYRAWEQFRELKDNMPLDEWQRESTRILQECSNKDWHESSPEVTALEKTLEGIGYTIFLSLKKTYPQLSVDSVDEILTGQNLIEAYQRLMVLSGLVAKKNDAQNVELNTTAPPAPTADMPAPNQPAE